jgi:hypothetical protein
MYADPALGFPWIPFVFVLVSGIGGGIYLLRKLPQPPPPPQIVVDWFEFFKPSLLWLLAVVLLWIGLSAMVKASCKPGPANTGGQAVFESFANPTPADISRYITEVENAIQRTETSMDRLAKATDDTCNIIQDVEEIYVGNEAAPEDDSELELSEDRQKKREELRRKRGQARFTTERANHAARVSKEPVLECFEDAGSDTELEEDELRTSAEELASLLDTAEVRLHAKKIAQINTSLKFAEIQFQKAIRAQEDFANPPRSLKGLDLLKHVDSLLLREAAFTRDVRAVLGNVTYAKQLQRDAKKKGSDLEEGKVSEETVKEFTPQPKATQGKCPASMFQFASYNGGFCCPTVPTNYSGELNDYTECPIGNICSINKETARGQPLCFPGALPDPEPKQGSCKAGMFEFNDGFCCPTKPTNYSPELRDYTTCPKVGVCAIDSKKTSGYPLC